MAHPIAYSAECEYKHLSSVRINFTEIREKLLEVKEKSGIDLTKNIDKLMSIFEKAVAILCNIQRKSLINKETVELLEEIRNDLNIFQNTIRTIRRALQKLRLDIYTLKQIKDEWLIDYFEPDFQSLIGNLNEIERHVTEISRAIEERIRNLKKAEKKQKKEQKENNNKAVEEAKKDVPDNFSK